MRRQDADVIVVGGGPAGAATANRLAKLGCDVLLLERSAFPRDKPCAEYFSPGVVDALDRLGVLDRVRTSDAAWPVGMRIRTPRREFLVSYWGGTGGNPGARTALGIRRPIFDQILLDAARDASVRVKERAFVRGAVVDGGRVVGVRVSGIAGTETLAARVVVAADGLHSAVARSLGLDRPAHWPNRLGLVAHYAGASGVSRFGEMDVRAGVYCGIAPVGRDVVSVGLVVPWNRRPVATSPECFFEQTLARWPAVSEVLGEARRISRVRGVGPLARRVPRVAGSGYLLVGDAAGFLDPFTGEGVYRALRGAELAATAVVQALQREDVFPVGYARSRAVDFGAKERICLLIQAFLTAPCAFDYVLGNLARRPVEGWLLGGVLGDIRPAKSALNPRFLWSVLRP